MTESDECSWCGHPSAKHRDECGACEHVSYPGEEDIDCDCPEFGWSGTSIVPGHNASHDVR